MRDLPPATNSGVLPDPPSFPPADLPPTSPIPMQTTPIDGLPTVNPDSPVVAMPQVQPFPADFDVDLDDPLQSDSQRLGGDVAPSAPSFRFYIGPDAPASLRPHRASGAAPPPRRQGRLLLGRHEWLHPTQCHSQVDYD